MRVGIIGGGLAGALLAWRIGLANPETDLELLAGDGRMVDATGVSGGLVRGFDVDPVNRRLAIDSLAELLGSAWLRTWSAYREIGSAYLCAPDTASRLDDAVDELDRRFPGSARVVRGRPVPGWADAGSGAGDTAVIERCAGYISPDRLRHGVLNQFAQIGGAVLTAAVSVVTPMGRAGARCVTPTGIREYDLLVIAAGRWTPDLLRRSGLPAAAAYRTKAIQYGVYAASGVPRMAFVDEVTGLYGRPAAGSRLLLGLPTDSWDLDPGRPPYDEALQSRAARVARDRIPGLRIIAREETVAAADCYTDPPGLRLRKCGPGIYTYTGGSGGAAKTALAASRRAADELAAAINMNAVNADVISTNPSTHQESIR